MAECAARGDRAVYWKRYSELLHQRHWSPSVIGVMDRVTDEILDLAGDPKRATGWKRRGLVIGDVQSGKTAAYTALCCKAADAGYRLVILLTGTLESLRRQTQLRLDEGFVGRDSSDILSATARAKRVVGAGEFDQRRFAGVFTSRSRDFSRVLLTQLGITLASINEPVLVVVKKNKKILDNLEGWLRGNNADAAGQIHEPLLLIDDEADNASVNTADPDNTPTAINDSIRGLISLFSRVAYVGFTATPFANIFIDPDTADEMRGQDLFPRDFIYALEPPTNYLGPARLFGDEIVNGLICPIKDADDYFPRGHKGTLAVAILPQSLRDAVDQFVLANVIRDLRGEGLTHRSMLINVSRFTAVQDGAAERVDECLKALQQDVRNYSQLDDSRALANPTLVRLKKRLETDFKEAGCRWPEVSRQLPASALPIVVRAVNQRTGASVLDYASHVDAGLRVIAVGGNSLSRGLTLEGLCTSYFFRNSQMYDTLLQMGRWFGYRDNYADLCRLWLTTEAEGWYRHITLASEELRQEVRRMQGLGLTPADFGLKVRSHPDALIVTARNKMRAAKEVIRQISFSGEAPETTRLSRDISTIRRNYRAVVRLVGEIRAAGLSATQSEWGTTYIWRGVPKEAVGRFLAAFQSDPRTFTFFSPEDEGAGSGLAKFVRETTDPTLQQWDVAMPSGEEDEISLPTLEPADRPRRRNVALPIQPQCSCRAGMPA